MKQVKDRLFGHVCGVLFLVPALALPGFATVIEIDSIEEMQLIGHDSGYPLDGDYLLTHDIDAAATASWNGGAGFDPIGQRIGEGDDEIIIPFGGNFDGGCHVISNLTIHRFLTTYIGLFIRINEGAQVVNLGLENVDIYGDWDAGALTAMNYGSISKCYVTGLVDGGESTAGLAANSGGSISMSYSLARVFVWPYQCSRAGGLATGVFVWGWTGPISQCYAAGFCGYGIREGGLVGGAPCSNLVTSSFWDVEASGATTSDGGTGLTTAEMKTKATFEAAGWDF